jgi:hypothetical protein
MRHCNRVPKYRSIQSVHSENWAAAGLVGTHLRSSLIARIDVKMVSEVHFSKKKGTLAVETEQLTEKIRSRAYEIWEHEGHLDGRDVDNWIAAEAECRLETTQSVAPKKPTPSAKTTDKALGRQS